MAFTGALYFFATAPSRAGNTHTINVFKKDFAGFAVECIGGAPFITGKWGTEADDFDTPLRSSQHSVNFWSVDPTTRLDPGGTILSRLKEVKTSGARDFLMVHLINGVEFWRGYALPRFTQTRLHPNKQIVTILAKDRLLSLDKQRYTRATSEALTAKVFSVGIAELLSDTGIDLPFDEESLWIPTGHGGDPLDLKYRMLRFFEIAALDQRLAVDTSFQLRFASDPRGQPFLESRSAQEYNSRTALAALARTFGLSFVQYDGAWKASYANAHLASNPTVRRYDTAGALVSTTTPAGTVALPDTYRRNTDDGRALDAISEARITYSYGLVKLGTLKNGDFLDWSTADTDQATSWTYTTASFFERGEALRGPPTGGPDYWLGPWSLHVKGSGVAVGTSDDAYAEACIKFASQDIGSFSAGTTDIRVSFWYGLQEGTPPGFLENLASANPGAATRLYYRVKFIDSTATTYWQTFDAGWKTDAAATDAEQRIRVRGAKDPAGNPSYQLDLLGQFEARTLSTLPGSGTGTLSIELGQPVFANLIPAAFIIDAVWAVYDGVRIDRGAENSGGAAATTYIVKDSTIDEGLTREVVALLGEGPFTFAAGSILETDGTTIADDWLRRSGASALAHSQLMGEDILRSGRDVRRTIRLTTQREVSGISPAKAVTLGGVDYWPAVVEIEWPLGATTVYAKELKDNSGTTATTTATDGSGGIFASPGDGAGIVTEAGRIIDNLIKSNLTVTTAVISAGAQTAMTINVLSENVWANNKSIYLIDRLTHELYTLTANGAQGSSATVTFDSFVFPYDVAVGSYLYADLADATARIVVSENQISLSVEAGALCLLDENISSPTARTSITVDGLAYDIQDNDVFWLIDNDPTSSATKYKLFASSDQSQSSTTLNFDNGSGGSVTIKALTGSAVVPDAAFQGSRIKINASEIDLRVTKINADARDGQLVARLNGAQSGTKTSIMVEFAGFDSGSGTAFKLSVGEIIKVVDASDSDVVQYLRVTAEELIGSTAIAVADASDVTASNVSLSSFADESMVYLFQGIPDIVTTGINIKLGSIEMDADLILFKTNALLSNHRTTPDWKITEDGFHVELVSGQAQPNSYSFMDGSNQQGKIWMTTGLELRIESDGDLSIFGGVNAADDIKLDTGGDIFLDASAGNVEVLNGDFIVNVNDLYVDQAGSVVGIRTATPDSNFALDVSGRIHVSDRIKVGPTGSPLAKVHIDQDSTSAAIPVLYLDQADVSEEFFQFASTIGTGNALEVVGAKTLTTTHFIKVTLPGGLTRYFPVGTIAA